MVGRNYFALLLPSFASNLCTNDFSVQFCFQTSFSKSYKFSSVYAEILVVLLSMADTESSWRMKISTYTHKPKRCKVDLRYMVMWSIKAAFEIICFKMSLEGGYGRNRIDLDEIIPDCGCGHFNGLCIAWSALLLLEQLSHSWNSQLVAGAWSSLLIFHWYHTIVLVHA